MSASNLNSCQWDGREAQNSSEKESKILPIINSGKQGYFSWKQLDFTNQLCLSWCHFMALWLMLIFLCKSVSFLAYYDPPYV